MPGHTHFPMHIEPRDFIETREGLILAVVDGRLEDGRVLCFLRYLRSPDGLRKVGTSEANALLEQSYPRYCHQSVRLAASLHGVPVSEIHIHHRPRDRVQALLALPVRDALQEKAVRWLGIMGRYGLDNRAIGLTGSLLIGAQKAGSDLDFVFYDRETFFFAREQVRHALLAGELQPLTDADWRESYQRRGCALSFEEYCWHERRKLNKGLCEGSKFDMTLNPETDAPEAARVRKLDRITLRATVTDASQAFDYPARFGLDHGEISEALSFTHTYAGQAFAGETVEITGMLEIDDLGIRRLVMGSSREAPGEYMKVLP